MPKRAYTKRNTYYDSAIGGKYFIEAKGVEILISTGKDRNMAPPFSSDAYANYQEFLEMHGISPEEAFSPALGQNYRIIMIDESNEEEYAGRFIKNGTARGKYHCDSVIVRDISLPIAFRVGDCPVVLIVGDIPGDRKIISLVHAGRAELKAEILKNTVFQMVSSHQMHLGSATAYCFPHICRYCYRLKFLDSATKEKAWDFLEFEDDHYCLDLMGWLQQQLEEAGIKRLSDAFFRCTAGVSPVCVSRLLHDGKNFQGFFSNYATHHQGAPKGRFLVVARIIGEKEENDKDDFYEV